MWSGCWPWPRGCGCGPCCGVLRCGTPEKALNRALYLAERAVNLDPGGFKGQAALAQAYLARGEHAQAIRTYEHLLALGPGGVEDYNNLAMEYRDAGEDSAAIYPLEQALAAQPDFDRAAAELARLRRPP